MSIMDLFAAIEKERGPALPITHLVVGLGNPGPEYAETRHNAGFCALDDLAARHGVRVDRARFEGLTGEGVVGGVRTLFLKPLTFMNNSGLSVAAAARFYRIPPENVLVLHDEISFDVGVIRLRRKGSAGGHNGLKSIIEQLGSDNFPRIKIGVGNKPRPDYDLVDWVLGKFPPQQRAVLREKLPDISAAAEMILAGQMEQAMARYSK